MTLSLATQDGKPVGNPAFRLMVENSDRASPNLSFGWSLLPEALEDLRARNVRYPFLLVNICRKSQDDEDIYKDVDRLLIPLDQGVCYTQFQRPGNYAISAAVLGVPSEDGQSKRQTRRTLRDEYFSYQNGKLPEIRIGAHRPNIGIYQPWSVYFDTVLVNVDESLFAPELPRWLSWWINLWFESRQDHECRMRRRAILAFTIQPPLVAVWISLLAGLRLSRAFFLLFCGWRHVSFKPVVHPFAMTWEEVNTREGYFPWTYKPENDFAATDKHGNLRPRWQKWLLTPLNWLLGAVGVCLLNVTWGWPVLLALATVVGSIFLWLLMTSIIAFFLSRSLSPKKEAAESVADYEPYLNRAVKERERVKQRMGRYYERRLAPLSGTRVGTRVADLPPSHRTISLRFADVVARVCRPYRR